MPRVKGGTVTRARHKKVLKLAKGYRGSKHRLFKVAKDQVMKGAQYAFRDRKANKRNFRRLWIARIDPCTFNGRFALKRGLDLVENLVRTHHCLTVVNVA